MKVFFSTLLGTGLTIGVALVSDDKSGGLIFGLGLDFIVGAVSLILGRPLFLIQLYKIFMLF